MGRSMAINGTVDDAFQKHNGDFKLVFQQWYASFLPFIAEVQANAVNFGLEMLVPRTEEAIHERNKQVKFF